MILGMDLTVIDDDIFVDDNKLRVRSPEALERLLGELKTIGYEIDDCRKPEHCTLGASAEEKVKLGLTLWFAHLSSIRYGKCGSCGQLISTFAIFFHGHKCEKCGAVTYRELVDESIVSFSFRDDCLPGFPKLICMKVKWWDTDNGVLYLYRGLIPGRVFSLSGVKAKRYLENNKSAWSYETLGKRTYIAVNYPLDRDKRPMAKVDMYDTVGHVYNSRIVKLWKGVEYGEYEKMPVPDYINIYEEWHKK